MSRTLRVAQGTAKRHGRGSLFFGYFFLATQKKVTRPPGRDPASHRSEKKQATQTPSLLTQGTARRAPTTSFLIPHSYDLTPHSSPLHPPSSPRARHAVPLRPHSSFLTPTTSLLTPHPYTLPPRPGHGTPCPYALTPHPYTLPPRPGHGTPCPYALTPHPSLLRPHSSPNPTTTARKSFTFVSVGPVTTESPRR